MTTWKSAFFLFAFMIAPALSACTSVQVDIEKTDENLFKSQTAIPLRYEMNPTPSPPYELPPLRYVTYAVLREHRDEGVSDEWVSREMLVTARELRCEGLIFDPPLRDRIVASCVVFTQHCEQNLLMRIMGLPFDRCARAVDNN